MTFSAQFVRFCMVGTIGFVVDAGTLHIMVEVFSGGPYYSRVVSFLVAATATWALNRRFTFRSSVAHRARARQWGLYVTVNAMGGAVNYGVYALCVHGSQLVSSYLFLGVAAGSLAGLLVNFLASKFLVFRTAAVS
jgi:putative flippase GtrA